MGVCPAHSKSDVSIVERTPCLGLPQAVNVEGLGPQEDWLLVRGRGGGVSVPSDPQLPNHGSALHSWWPWASTLALGIPTCGHKNTISLPGGILDSVKWAWDTCLVGICHLFPRPGTPQYLSLALTGRGLWSLDSRNYLDSVPKNL